MKTSAASRPYLRRAAALLRPLVLILCLVAIVMAGVAGGGDAAWAADAKKKTKKKVKPAPPYNPTNAYYVIEAESGTVLDQLNADRTLYPASLTKLMTLLMVFDALEANKITLQSRIRFSTHAANMPPSRIGVPAGSSISVDQAIRTLVTKSANDVAAAVAENLGGSEARFAQLMTLRAREIGMRKTRFINASGLHNKQQTTSVVDMAILGQYLWKNYPKYYGYFALREFYYGNKMHQNHNHLMKTYRGMDGMKTGYITASGFNLVASARRDGIRIIAVVIGGKTATARNKQMEGLLDKGFETAKRFRAQAQAEARAAARGGAATKAGAPPPAPVSSPVSPPVRIPPAENLSGSSRYVPPPTGAANPAYQAPQARGQGGGMQTLTVQPPPAPNSPAAPVAPTTPSGDNGWSVQIGAYQDRISTDQAIYKAMEKLPDSLRRVNPVVIPLRTGEAKWIFRARLTGYTKTQAYNACRVLQNCLVISPTTN